MTHFLPMHKLLFSAIALASIAFVQPLAAQEPPLPEGVLPPVTQEEGAVDTVEALPDAAAPAEATEELPPVEPEEEQVVASLPEPADWTRSLMFEDESAAALQSLYRSYLARTQPQTTETAQGDSSAPVINLDAIRSAVTGEEPEEIPEEVLKFTLNSLAYETPRDWTIWVNGKIYADEIAREGFSIDRSELKVVEATRDRVTYLWQPIAASFDKVQQRWEDKKRLEGVAVNTQAAQGEQVVFDAENKTVTISLRPNQTFVSQLMTVMEGSGEMRNTNAPSDTTAADAVPEADAAAAAVPLAADAALPMGAISDTSAQIPLSGVVAEPATGETAAPVAAPVAGGLTPEEAALLND